MTLDLARLRDEARRFCRIAEETTPAWLRILFVASLGALWLVSLDRPRQWGSLWPLTGYYVALNVVMAAGTTYLLAVRIRRGYLPGRSARSP